MLAVGMPIPAAHLSYRQMCGFVYIPMRRLCVAVLDRMAVGSLEAQAATSNSACAFLLPK